jgi:hypothetical protein
MISLPWLPYRITNLIIDIKPKRVFEWGSGASTLFFSSLPSVEKLVSIEHNQEWYDKTKDKLPSWVEYKLIPYENGEIGPDKSEPSHYKSGSTELGKVNFKNYASVIDQYALFDLILIDGVARPSCIVHAFPHAYFGGCIVIDNTNDRPYYLEKTANLFGNWEDGWERLTYLGNGPILDYKWETTIFFNVKSRNSVEKINQ